MMKWPWPPLTDEERQPLTRARWFELARKVDPRKY